MLNKELFDLIKSGVSTFKKVMPERFANIQKVFDIYIILLSIAKRESGYNFTIENPSNRDYGLFQFIPSTLQNTIKIYQKDEKQIKLIQDNFYSKDIAKAVPTQVFIMCILLSEYAKNILTKQAAGYYKYFLDSITDTDLKNILFAYLQHAGGGLVFSGKEAKNYEMITTLIDILDIAANIYKTVYNIDKEIKFDVNLIFEKNKIDAVIKSSIIAMNNEFLKNIEGLK